jgi:5-methylcytosine-specific restriction enzyme A
VPKRIPLYKPTYLDAPTSINQLKHQAKEKVRHREQGRTRHDKEINAFYSTTAWRKCRAAFLAEHPLCEDCLIKGRTTAATVADHQVEQKHDQSLAFDYENLRALCQSCHNRKTGLGVMKRRWQKK